MTSLLISFIIFLCIIGVVWFIVSRIPLPVPFNWIAQVILGLIALVWLLSQTGHIGAL